MAIVRREFFVNEERYKWDLDDCSPSRGYAQVDTRQDAPYYGTWANPFIFTIVCFAEGDLDTTIADTAEEFCREIRKFVAWNDAEGVKRFKGIDPGLSPDIEKAFKDLGLGDLLY